MPSLVFVISDLHLGGASDFQMCSPAGQARLVEFLDWMRRKGPDVHLVLAGDVVDFLAEKDGGAFQAFTADADAAQRKLEAIVDRTRPVWDGLRALVSSGCALTVLLGNHDLELCFPASRQFLLQTLGPGRVELIYDNQALAIGPVLIEHGNRYDGWNAVRHDSLRRVRSRLSRGATAPPFPVPPGSELVARVMNPLKEKHAWVDLLKPETSGVLPLLAFLDPPRWEEAWTTLRQRLAAARVKYDDDGNPRDDDLIGAGADRDGRNIAIAHDLAAGGSVDQVSSSSRPPFYERWKASMDDSVRRAELDLLLKALQSWREDHARAFRVDHEEDDYLVPARAQLDERHRVVVFGHTHLPKRVTIEGNVYLNTGTWADLIRVPEEVFAADGPTARAALSAFADDLAAGELADHRRLVPTFAQIELDGQRVVRADVHLFDEAREHPSITTDLLRELFRKAP